jgi:hypothetical protein
LGGPTLRGPPQLRNLLLRKFQAINPTHLKHAIQIGFLVFDLLLINLETTFLALTDCRKRIVYGRVILGYAHQFFLNPFFGSVSEDTGDTRACASIASVTIRSWRSITSAMPAASSLTPNNGDGTPEADTTTFGCDPTNSCTSLTVTSCNTSAIRLNLSVIEGRWLMGKDVLDRHR